MQEIFWFGLGAFVYLALNQITFLFHKIKYITDVKIYAFQLIGFAYEHLVFATTAKYIAIDESTLDKEKVKIFKNLDEVAFEEWKKEVALGLKEAVPPVYRGAMEVENWDDIMNALDVHYKKVLHSKGKHSAKKKKVD